MFSSLKVKNFRIYWLGMFISLMGTWIQSAAQSWLVFQLTKSAFLLGMVGFLGSLPIFILSLIGGVVADRVDKRRILIFTQSAFMVLAFLLAVLTQMQLITAAQIMLIAVLNGIVMAFDMPSRQAVVVELVGKKYLFNAIAMNSVAFSSSRVIGPALAGILVASIGMSGCFYINGVSFFAVIGALFFIRINNNLNADNSKHASALEDIKEGLRYIKDNRLILLLIIMVGMVSLFGVSYVILMPIFAQDILQVGIKGLGFLMSATGVGALLAGLILAAATDIKQKGRFLVLSSLTFSLSLILFSLSRSYLFSVLILIFIGWSSVTAVATINTLLQTMVRDELRGRVMSAFMFTFAGVMPLGNLMTGWLASVAGAPVTVMICGIACSIFFIAITISSAGLRQIR